MYNKLIIKIDLTKIVSETDCEKSPNINDYERRSTKLLSSYQTF